MSRSTTDVRRVRIAQGLCGDCAQPAGGKWRCASCQAYAYQARLQKAIDDDLCVNCTARPPRDGRTQCEYCSQVAKERYDRKKTSRRASCVAEPTQRHQAPPVPASEEQPSGELARRGTDSEAAE